MNRYVIKQEDVGKLGTTPVKYVCPCCGHTEVDFPFIELGEVFKEDVGKRCKKINGNWYVENYNQFIERINKNRKGGYEKIT